ncbi:MAG: MoxR family ATPase [Eubacteriales bacterium]|jgi:nitric oxide reductase NorQ protein
MAVDPIEYLKEEKIDDRLLRGIEKFRDQYPTPEKWKARVPVPQYFYYGTDVWRKALAALLEGENLLLIGPKATGKNVLAENLAAVLGRPMWNISFHINVDAAYLIGADTYNGKEVVFRPGPVTLAAENGGFAVLDEINMAKNEALAVLHSILDFRRVIDLPGYDRIDVNPATRFIGTMNYGYAGTRELNEALCSRFAVLQMPVIAEDDLKKLFRRSFPDMKPDIAEQFMKLFYDLQKKAEHADISERAVDLRGLLDACRMIRRGITSGEALEMTVTDKSFDTYERGLIHDAIAARIPEDLTAEDVFESSGGSSVRE